MNVSEKPQSTFNKCTEWLEANAPAPVTLFNGVWGGFSVAFTQPSHILKLYGHMEGKAVKSIDLCKRIIQTDGVSGFWKGWKLSMIKSGQKQALKGSILAKIHTNDTIPGWLKSTAAAAFMTATMTPLDKWLAVILGNKIGLLEAAKEISKRGILGWYEGWQLDFLKNNVEAICVFLVLYCEHKYYTEGTRKLTKTEQFGEIVVSTVAKTVITNPLDVLKTVFQMKLTTENTSILTRVCKAIEEKGGLGAVFKRSLVPRLATNFFGMAGSILGAKLAVHLLAKE